MKRLLMTFGILIASASCVIAQDNDHSNSKPISGSIAANIGVPTTSGYSIAFGFDVQGDYEATEGLKITGSIGYENYPFKGGGGSGYFIPLLAGAKFNLGSEKVYGHAQLGYGFAKGGGGAFGYAPSIGYYVSPNFDLSLKYLAFSKNSNTLGSINLRAAYNF